MTHAIRTQKVLSKYAAIFKGMGNPHHDPKNGQFTSGPGGGPGYAGPGNLGGGKGSKAIPYTPPKGSKPTVGQEHPSPGANYTRGGGRGPGWAGPGNIGGKGHPDAISSTVALKPIVQGDGGAKVRRALEDYYQDDHVAAARSAHAEYAKPRLSQTQLAAVSRHSKAIQDGMFSAWDTAAPGYREGLKVLGVLGKMKPAKAYRRSMPTPGSNYQ